MNKKKFSGLVLLILVTILLGACQAGKATITASDCGKSDIFCVGLVTGVGKLYDKSFNQSAWEGIQKAQTAKMADWVQYTETIDIKDYGQNIATLAQAGYDVVVTVGEKNAEATATAANSFPDTLFIGVDQNQTEVLPNLVGLVFHEDQSGFLAGALAAQMTKTSTIAGIFSTGLDASMVAFKKGYEAGARNINPDIRLITTYYPEVSDSAYNDPSWGAMIAAQAIRDGADIIFGAGGSTGNGALIETARNPGLYCIGVDTDQWETTAAARPCLISSVVKMITPGVFDIIKLARDGAFPTGNYFGASGMAPYHDFDSVIPQTVKDNINEIITGLQSGSITTGYKPGE